MSFIDGFTLYSMFNKDRQIYSGIGFKNHTMTFIDRPTLNIFTKDRHIYFGVDLKTIP